MSGGLGEIRGDLVVGADLKGLKDAEAGFKGLDGMASRSLGGIQSASAATGKILAGSMLAGGLAIGAIGASSASAAMTFQQGMSNIQAVAGATADEMELIRDKAMQIGADTAFSAQEGAMGIEELLKAGVNVEGVLGGAADAAIALASAGGIALPESAAIMSAAMNNFGLSAEQLPHVADLISGAANTSAISVSDFGMSMTAAGAVANLAGVSLDDMSIAITAMGNAGIKGSDAGTSLKTMMMNLVPTTKTQIAAFKELGIVTEDGGNLFLDAAGKTKPFGDIAQVLQEKLADLSESERMVALEAMFGSDAIRAAAVIADTGAAGWEKYSSAMGNVTAADVAKTRLDNLAGSMDAFKGSIETVQIKLGEKLLPTIRSIVDAGGGLVNALGVLIDGDAAAGAEATSGKVGELNAMMGETGVTADASTRAAQMMSETLAKVGVNIDPSVFVELFTAITTGMDRIKAAFASVDGDKVGGGLVTIITKIVDAIVFLVENPGVAKAGAIFVGLFAAIAPIMAIVGPLIPLLTGLGGAFVSLMTFLAPAGVAVTGIGSALGVLATIITGPVGLAIAAVVAGFLLWRAKGDEIKAWLSGFASSVGEFFSGLGNIQLPSLDGLKAKIAGIFGPKEAEAAGQTAGTGLTKGLGQAIDGFASSEAPGLAARLAAGLKAVGGDETPPFLVGLAKKIEEFKPPSFDLAGMLPDVDLGALIQPALDGLSGALSGAWAGFKDNVIAPAQTAIFDYLHEQWMLIPEDIRADLILIAENLQERFDEYLTTVQEKTAEIRADIEARFTEIVSDIKARLAEAYAVVQGKFNEIRDAVSAAVASARDAAAARFGEIAATIAAKIEQAKAAAQAKFDELRTLIGERLDYVREIINSKIAEWRQVAEDKIAELVSAAHAAFDPIIERVRGIADRAVESLREGLSRAKEAVLSPLRDAIAGISSVVSEAVSTAQRIGTSIIDGIVTGLRNAKQAVIDAILTIARSSLDTIKEFLGINSPAKRLVPYGESIPEGMALGINRGTPFVTNAIKAMGLAVTNAVSEIDPFSNKDFFLVDEEAERAFLDASLRQLEQLKIDLDRAVALVDAAKVDINRAFDEFFGGGGLDAIIAQIEQLSGSKLGADFFKNAGLDASSFDDIRQQIAALTDDPDQQQELWEAMIDGLAERWRVYYDERVKAEEALAKTARKELDATKRQISDAKKADKDADTTALEQTAADQEAALQKIQDRIDALKDQNDTVTDAIKEQTFEVGNQFDRYGRLNDLAEKRRDIEEETRKFIMDQVRAREDAALDAEKQASDGAIAILEAQQEEAERIHDERMGWLDDQIEAEELAAKAAMEAEEKRHAAALAGITAEVDAKQAAIDAELSGLDRAKAIIDAFAAGNPLTDQDAAFLRSLGLDPETLKESTQALTETTNQVDALQGLLGRLDSKSSKRITKDQLSDAERKALEKLQSDGNLTDAERRRVDVALKSKGGISQKQLAELLNRAVGQEDGSEGFLQKQVEAQQTGLDLLNQEIERRETLANKQQGYLDAERAGLQGLIDAEDKRHEDFKLHANKKLAALQAERELAEEMFRDEQEHFNRAKQAEKDAHDERVRQLQEEYALELLRLGETEERVREILDEQRQRAAEIAAEAKRRADAARVAAESAVRGSPEAGAPPPPAAGDKGIGVPPPGVGLPIPPIPPPSTDSFLMNTLRDAVDLKSVMTDLAALGFKPPNNFTVNQDNRVDNSKTFTTRDVAIVDGSETGDALLDVLGRN